MNWKVCCFCSIWTPPSLVALFLFSSFCVITVSVAGVLRRGPGWAFMSADSKVSPFLVIMDTTLPALSLSSSGSSKVPLILSHRALGPDSVTLYFSSLPPPIAFLFSLNPRSSVCVRIYCPGMESWLCTLLFETAKFQDPSPSLFPSSLLHPSLPWSTFL